MCNSMFFVFHNVCVFTSELNEKHACYVIFDYLTKLGNKKKKQTCVPPLCEKGICFSESLVIIK